jgi:hypothetical protein
MATVTPGLETLTALVRRMFPHASFPDGPYERAAAAIAESASADPRNQAQLENGLRDLEAHGFGSLDVESAAEYLRSISDSAFFALVRGEVVTSLYNDPEVWNVLGWQGESFSKGGYLERGFADLDWLPAARVEGPSA